MSLSNTWQNLVASALLGTERQKPNLSELEFLRSIDSSTPETALLSASAVLSQYKKAGLQLASTLEPKLEQAETETHPQVSPAQQSLLLECLNSRTEQLTECLKLVAKTNLRAPFELLSSLIHKANFDSSLRESVLPVLGARGLWLAKHLDAGTWVGGSSLDESVWELGLPAQRRDYLSTLRGSDPQLALQKLEAVWKQEPAKIRSDLIATLEVNLSMTDEEFLELALDDKGKDVRETAAKLLTKLPTSKLMERMKTRVTPLLQYTPEGKAEMLGLKKGTPAKFKVTLPEACDKAMQRDGIELKPPSWQKIGEKAYWLKQMLEITPLELWEKSLNATPTELVSATNKNEYQKLILEAWRSSLRHYRYNLAWADALKQSGKAEFQLIDYTFVMSQLDLENFMILRLKLANPRLQNQDSAYFLGPFLNTWSAKLTRIVCEQLEIYFEARDKLPEAEIKKHNSDDYRLQAHLGTYSRYMHPQTALEILGKLKPNNEFEFLTNALETLQFRVKLQNAFTGEQP
jgi:hypothetical protein